MWALTRPWAGFGLVWLLGCTFEPPAPVVLLVPGAPCQVDGQCQSGRCAGGSCAECKQDEACGAGRRCAPETGRCVDAPAGVAGQAPAAEGRVQVDDTGRHHVGRVGFVPVTAEGR